MSKPKPDASLYYRTQHSRELRELADQKAAEAREILQQKLGLPSVNRIMASKSDGSSSRR